MRNLHRHFHLNQTNTTANNTNNTVKLLNLTKSAAVHKAHLSKNLIIFIIISSLLLISLLVLLIICCIRKKRFYRDYNQQPETLIRRPSLTQLDRIDECQYTWNKMQTYNLASKQTQIMKKKLPQGTIHQVIFRPAGEDWCSVMFTKALEETSYFEVEVLSSEAEVMIGYGYQEDIERRFVKTRDIGSYSIGFSNLGIVKNNGILLHQYRLNPSYGDCIGIGITREDQRVWFTYNGVLKNEPTLAEQQRWLKDNVEEDVETKQKKQQLNFIQRFFAERPKKGKTKALPKAGTPTGQSKDDVVLTKQKVTMHASRFCYLAFISCKCTRLCQIVVNTGGQMFRFPDHAFKQGLYKEKEESENDDQEEVEQQNIKGAGVC